MSETRETCPGCLGAGDWFTYCCDGAGGCSCRGVEVQMGTCNVCDGAGFVDGEYNRSANVDAIRGLHFIGTGPADMYGIWPNRAGIKPDGRS